MRIPDNYTFMHEWLPINDVHSVACVICKGEHRTQKVFAFLLNGKEFSIMHCIADNLLFLSPQPGYRYTEALYNHASYFTGEDDMYGINASDEKSRVIATIRITEISENLRKIGKSTIAGKSFLEIGCAYGHTLLEALKNGAVLAEGVEFSQDAVSRCAKAGLRVVQEQAKKPFESTIHQNSYDVIAMYSLLEHVSDPSAFLSRVKPLLAKDGILVTRVPEMSENGPWLSLFDHFWHFTRPSFEEVLNISGFEVLEIFPSGVFEGTTHPGKLSSMTAIARLK